MLGEGVEANLAGAFDSTPEIKVRALGEEQHALATVGE